MSHGKNEREKKPLYYDLSEFILLAFSMTGKLTQNCNFGKYRYPNTIISF